jgi:hypothetical protein
MTTDLFLNLSHGQPSVWFTWDMVDTVILIRILITTSLSPSLELSPGIATLLAGVDILFAQPVYI